jgi:hypothetical protein
MVEKQRQRGRLVLWAYWGRRRLCGEEILIRSAETADTGSRQPAIVQSTVDVLAVV